MKLQRAYWDRTFISQCHFQFPRSSNVEIPKESIRETKEIDVFIHNIPSKALLDTDPLDTGSTISVISESFYEENLASIPVQSLKNFIKIKCADGQDLPYKGYIETEVTFTFSGIQNEEPKTLLSFNGTK